MKLIKATPEDSETLSELAIRSKAYWGYDADFMQDCAEELSVTPEMAEKTELYALYDEDKLQGFYCFRTDQEHPELTLFFVEPDAIGRGYGRALWDHLLERVAARQVNAFYIIADPYAAPFYAHVGAGIIGEVESPTRPGRMLPLMQYVMNEDQDAEQENIA